jgi:hypothetical protein
MIAIGRGIVKAIPLKGTMRDNREVTVLTAVVPM